MPTLSVRFPVVAVVYSDSVAAADILRRAVEALREFDVSFAGLLQQDVRRAGRNRCDMILMNLTSDECIRMSEDRGPGARGCHLDPSVLLTAMEDVRASLGDETSILVLNKFGKSEAEGGGLRPLIADALERGIPVVLGVPWRNIEGWREFAGDLGCEVAADMLADARGRELLVRLGLDVASGAPDDARAARCSVREGRASGE